MSRTELPPHRWKTFVSYEDLKSPPLSEAARRKIGLQLRHLQQGCELRFPGSRTLRSNPALFELRIPDDDRTWRVIYYTGPDEVVVLRLFRKTTRKTPSMEIELSLRRLGRYLAARRG